MTAAFLAAIRPLFGGKLKQAQVDGLTRILTASAGLPRSYRAYILATAFHETARTMQPIREYGRGKGKRYGAVDATGKAPYGRGSVQLTWRDNYLWADRELNLSGRLAADYDLALDAKIAADILVERMVLGWFTTKALRDDLHGDYPGARRIVNGQDDAQMIAGYARQFEAALAAGGDAAPSIVGKSNSSVAGPVARIIAAILKLIKGA